MSRFNPYNCPRCHLFGHNVNDCPSRQGATQETPSHNGSYRGTATVVVVPPGTSGEDLARMRRGGRSTTGP